MKHRRLNWWNCYPQKTRLYVDLFYLFRTTNPNVLYALNISGHVSARHALHIRAHIHTYLHTCTHTHTYAPREHFLQTDLWFADARARRSFDCALRHFRHRIRSISPREVSSVIARESLSFNATKTKNVFRVVVSRDWYIEISQRLRSKEKKKEKKLNNCLYLCC